MTPEAKLAALLAAEAPPRRDLAFEATVMERVARRRAFAAVGALAPWTIAAAAICWAARPMAQDLGPAITQALDPVLMPLGLVGAVLLGAAAADRTFRRIAIQTWRSLSHG